MFTPRKRHLRKKRFFLPEQRTFALFNGSNLKASQIAKIRLLLQNAKLYSVPLYLTPPKLGIGCPLIMIVYETLQDLQTNVLEIALKIDCLGISIDKKWYSINFLEKNNTIALNKKTLSLLLVKYNTINQ
uniref:hypothetical protein n=1 Tax=Alaria marginata TaxID=98221 RepID=UPI001D11847A|nr:hypothetical protein LK120_mgp25 [Alaria marginata]UAX19705.1 hypothetical protein [Alaria marginata]UAX19971.1 hypothetical protein [Alaria marginata]WKY96725.1 hypothetical protein [Alaria marginata]WKY96763.1 hypothetical protein [Alaria marginata]WKY96801.1 hypothetical protein [Alaria marginata]